MKKCYIYTRVSTKMQVDGYSLEAQAERLRNYAKAQDMTIVREYSDAGESGKSITGRIQFQQMIDDIIAKKDNVEYVLVFKLSRFGRNTADVLSTLQTMQDYGVNLACIEDGIDSGKGSGKLMISVLSAVAEIERDNILIQTKAGREQKAKEGIWNGGFPPLGYDLKDGQLIINKEESKIVKDVFKKYTTTNLSLTKIVNYLNKTYTKPKRPNSKAKYFDTSFVVRMIENPTYCGKIAYGRTKNVLKEDGTRNNYHRVRSSDYILVDGKHKAIISTEMWDAAQEIRKKTKHKKQEKIHDLGHEYLLSGIVFCPICGQPLYGEANRKKKKDGGHYKTYFAYKCPHRKTEESVKCTFGRVSEEKINKAVEEILFKLIDNEGFAEAIKEDINSNIDISDIEKERASLEKEQRIVKHAKEKYYEQQGNLDPDSKTYKLEWNDLKDQINNQNIRLAEIDDLLLENKNKLKAINEKHATGDSIYQQLKAFDSKVYSKMSDTEKKQLLSLFIDSVELFDKAQEDGRWLKTVNLNFPVYYNGKPGNSFYWGKNTTGETCCLLVKTE